MNIKLKKHALLSLVALVACGCSSTTDKAASGDTGGTVVVMLSTEPSTLLPPMIDGTTEKPIVWQIFDRLADIGSDLSTVGDSGYTPRLATSWSWSKDSLSIAFHIDPRARWHDGLPVRANDVRFSYQLSSDTSSGSKFVALFGNIDSVSVADSLTAVFWYKRRTPQQFYDATYNLFIMPAHAFANVPMRDVSKQPFAHAPIGSGRFRFVKWEPQQRIEMIADTGNYRGRAKLDRVIWTMASDGGAAVVKLFNGDGDVLEKLPPANVSQVAGSKTLRLQLLPTFTYNFIGFNSKARKDSVTPHPIFSDVRVRRAISMGINRDQIVNTLFDSLAQTAIGPAPRSLFPWDKEIHVPAYDVAHAKALLDSAGWTDAAKNGKRSKDGAPLAFEIIASHNKSRVNAAVLVQQQLAAIGVAVSVKELDAVRDRVLGGDFDAFVTGYGMDPGRLGMPQSWTRKGFGGVNVQRYYNPKFDATLDSAIATQNLERAHKLWVRAFQIIIDDAPAIWLYEELGAFTYHRRIRITGARLDDVFAGLADWTIDPTMRIDRDKLGLPASR